MDITFLNQSSNDQQNIFFFLLNGVDGVIFRWIWETSIEKVVQRFNLQVVFISHFLKSVSFKQSQ